MAPTPDYAEDETKMKKFLVEHIDSDGTSKYTTQLQQIANRSRRIFDLHLDDLALTDDDLVMKIKQNTKRYITILGNAVDSCLPAPSGQLAEDDVYDIISRARSQNMDGTQLNPAQSILLRRYEVRIVPLSSEKTESLRNIRAVHIGQLVTVRAMVARVSDVKPMVQVVTYTCEQCSEETYQVVSNTFYGN
jgi:DNA replication licensing factor MCM7